MNILTRHLNGRGTWRRTIALSIMAALVVATVAAPVGQAAPSSDKGNAHSARPVRPVPPKAPPQMNKPQPRGDNNDNNHNNDNNNDDSNTVKPSVRSAVPYVAPALRGKNLVDPIDLKVLVLTGNGDDGNLYELPAIKAELDRIGVPYDVLMASTHTLNGTPYIRSGETPEAALTRILSNTPAPTGVAPHGYYEGIMLTTGSLLYCGSTGCQYGFTQNEWTSLWSYEAAFGIRQVTHYTSPGVGFPTNYCLSATGSVSLGTGATPIVASLTAAGQALFSYLQPTAQIKIANAYVYKAVADPTNASKGNTLTPLLTWPDGSILVSTCKFADGRENLAMTFNNNADDQPDVNFIRSLLMSYGVVNWVTKGHFLGERHVNQGMQVDDLFLDGDIWNPARAQAGVPFNPGADCVGTQAVCPTARLSGPDIVSLVNWQNSASTKAAAPQFKFEFGFNGSGTDDSTLDPKFVPDTLSPEISNDEANFNMINHTYTHINLDSNCVAWDTANPANCTQFASPTAAQITSELQQNDAVALDYTFTNYTKSVFINPDISGLTSSVAQQALFNFGIRWEISDTSRPGQNNPSPNVGIPNALQPGILEVPRHANNLFYNLYLTQDWVSEYNCFYNKNGITVNGATIHCGDSTFDQYRYLTSPIDYNGIIDHESDSLLSYLLRWDTDPLMFHQENLIQYAAGKTLLTDLLNATFTKYNAFYKLPIRNLRELEIGGKMIDRDTYNKSGVTANMVPCGTVGATPAVTVQAPRAVTVPVTGVKSGTTAEVYGGQNISYLKLVANTPVTVPLTCP